MDVGELVNDASNMRVCRVQSKGCKVPLQLFPLPDIRRKVRKPTPDDSGRMDQMAADMEEGLALAAGLLQGRASSFKSAPARPAILEDSV